MIRTYAVCDECEDAETLYKNVQDPDFKYEAIIGDDGSPKFEETVDGWVIKGRQDPADALRVEFEYYCPECAALDGIMDSGDRVAQ